MKSGISVVSDKLAKVLHKKAQNKGISKTGSILKIESKKYSKSWQIIACKDEKRYYVLKEDTLLGEGAAGKVYVAESLVPNEKGVRELVAVKCFKMEHNASDILHEKVVLEKLSRLKGHVEHDGLNYLMMECYPGVSLLDYLYSINKDYQKDDPKRFERKNIPFPVLVRITIAALEEVQLLHNLGVAHRDIKPENFIIHHPDPESLDIKLKLIDLDSAFVMNDARDKSRTAIRGTYGYNDPAIVEARTPYDYHHDLFSLAVMLAEMFTQSNYQSEIRKLLPANGKIELNREQIFKLLSDILCEETQVEPENFEAFLESITNNTLHENANKIAVVNFMRNKIKHMINLLASKEISNRLSSTGSYENNPQHILYWNQQFRNLLLLYVPSLSRGINLKATHHNSNEEEAADSISDSDWSSDWETSSDPSQQEQTTIQLNLNLIEKEDSWESSSEESESPKTTQDTAVRRIRKSKGQKFSTEQLQSALENLELSAPTESGSESAEELKSPKIPRSAEISWKRKSERRKSPANVTKMLEKDPDDTVRHLKR